MRPRLVALLPLLFNLWESDAQLVKSWEKALIQPLASGLTCSEDGIAVIAGADAPTCYFGSLQNNTVARTTCNALDATQRWEVVSNASSSLATIASKASGLCWTASNPGTTSASSLLQSTCDPARSVSSGELFALVFTGMVPGCPPESGAAAYQVQALLPDASRRCLTQPRSSAAPQFAPCSGSPVDATQTFLIWTGPRPVAVYTDRYGISRTGVNGREKTIVPQLLASNGFGQVGSYPVIGAVFAHPLVAPNVRIGDASITGVIIATEENYVYFFNADQVANPTPVWVVGPLGIPLTQNDVGIDTGNGIANCGSIAPNIGITGTPVIDPTTNTLYFVAFSKPTSAQITGQPYAANHTLYSLDLSTGANKYPPMIISGRTTLNGETVDFKPTYQNQRSGLAFTNGHVLVAFGAHCDFNLYSGWLFALQPALQKVTGVWRSVKQSGSDGGGVWTSGTAPLVDPSGYIYVTTGNGLDQPQLGYYGNAVVKLTQPPGSASTPWPVADYFMPADNPQTGDQDFGVGMPPLFTVGSRNLIALGGKPGKAWIQDISNLQQKSTRAYQAINDVGFILSSFLYDDANRRLWINPMPYGSPKSLQAYQLNSSGLFTTPPVALGYAQNGNGGTPSLTHNNGAGSILWTAGAYGVRAYNASGAGALAPIYADAGAFGNTRFQNFVVANGLGYLAGVSGVTIYGAKS